jgi:Domain of unknown function (DUF4494)
MQYYQVKVVTELESEDGKTKKITNAYLVEAMSFTEVESIINAEYRNAPHPFSIKSVAETKIEKVLYIEDYKQALGIE